MSVMYKSINVHLGQVNNNERSTNLEEVRSLDAIVCLPVWLNTTNIHNLDLVIKMALLDICVQLYVDQHYQDGYCTV